MFVVLEKELSIRKRTNLFKDKKIGRPIACDFDNSLSQRRETRDI